LPPFPQGVAILYLLFGAMCALCLLFLYTLVPETKGHVADHHHPSAKRKVSIRRLPLGMIFMSAPGVMRMYIC
jgi:hypothetical protein